jgi:hypothetical protein
MPGDAQAAMEELMELLQAGQASSAQAEPGQTFSSEAATPPR